jgi:hypothetical protein
MNAMFLQEANEGYLQSFFSLVKFVIACIPLRKYLITVVADRSANATNVAIISNSQTKIFKNVMEIVAKQTELNLMKF